MSWRRPIYRWNWRMLRRERRQWTLVIGMIAVAVAAGVLMVSAVFTASPPPNGVEMGNGTSMLVVDGAASDGLLSDAIATFDTVDAVEISTLRRPGFASPLPVRAFDPEGANAGPLVALLEGAYPADRDQIAVTRHQLDRFGAAIGDVVEFDGASFEVTGIVENPSRLADEFVFATPGAVPPETVQFLIDAPDDVVTAFTERHPGLAGFEFSDDTRAASTVIVTVAASIVFLEIALLVVSIVTMLAQRRERQLGLLAAAGASRRQLRSSVVAGGMIAGVAAAVIGLVAGALLAWWLVPLLDAVAGRRIDAVTWPWPSIVTIGVIAVATTSTASWWPARRIARATVARSLRRSRPEQRRPVVMTVLGALLVAAGIAGLIATFSLDDTERPVFVDAAAFIAVPFGAVLLAPAAVRALVAFAPARTAASRMALRDIGRFPSRSAATAASLVLVLAIPVMGAAGFRIFERSPENVASMPPDQLLIRPDNPWDGTITGAPFEPADQARFDDAVATLVGDANVVALRQPIVETGHADVGPTIVESGPFGGSTSDTTSPAFREPLVFGTIVERVGSDFGIDVIPTYVATPELLAALDLDGLGRADIVTNRDGPHGIVQYLEEDVGLDESMRVEVRDFTRFGSTPGALLAPDFARSLGHDVETVGWLVHADVAFSDARIAEIGAAAAELGFVIETHTPASDGRTVVLVMIVVALLFGLGIVAVVGALHRAETASTHAAFEAIGATRRFRRRVHAWTMASLTAVAALLAVGAGLLSQVGFAREVLGTGRLIEAVPPITVAIVLVAAPALSYGLGWSTARQHQAGAGRAADD